VKKILVLAICFLTALSSFAQKPTQIQIVRSDNLQIIGDGISRLTNPVLLHDGSTLAADSVKLNQNLNVMDAFGHVVITQPDGKLIYSDLLNYDGNTKQAILTNNVRMIDGKATLTTNYLTYNLGTKIGTYTTNGKIVNDGDVLTSQTGYYFGATRDAYFRKDVVITSKDALIKADTMKYNTISKDVNFFGPTNIYSKEDTIYTELGNYNTVTRIANGYKNNRYNQGTRFMKSDTGYYDNIKGTGRVKGRVVFTDSEQKIGMNSDVGYYTRADSSILLTKNAYITFATLDSAKIDTIWMSADTLITKVIYKKDFIPVRKSAAMKYSISKNPIILALLNKDSANKSTPFEIPVRDSILKVSPDDTTKTRVVFAFHHAKIFKSDMQAVTDSISYSYADSIIRCYRNPMIWAQGTQMSGDTILLKLKNRRLHDMQVQYNGFIAMTGADSIRYNQITGKFLMGIFKDNKLEKMFVDGNAERVYFLKDSINYTSMNRTISSGIYFELADRQLKRMYSSNPDGNLFPIKNVNAENEVLKGFIWKPKNRPKSKEEVIHPSTVAPVEEPPVKPKEEGRPLTPAAKKK
jgi:lipopolysaccharide export system protein LptA